MQGAIHPVLTPATGGFDRPLTPNWGGGGVSHRLMHFDSAVIIIVGHSFSQDSQGPAGHDQRSLLDLVKRSRPNLSGQES